MPQLPFVPPIPKTLDLNAHSKTFFHIADRCGPVAARFKLKAPELDGKVFIGRAAEFCTGGVRLIVKEFTGDCEADARAPLLVSALSLPVSPKTPKELADAMERYFARTLDYPNAKSSTRDWRFRVPTLLDKTTEAGFTRLHVDAASGLGLQFSPDCCHLIDFKRDRHGKAQVRPAIEIGDALFGWETPKCPLRAFIEMDAETFHERAETVIGDDGGEIYHVIAFRGMNYEERYCHVFGCDLPTVKRAQAVLKLALRVEMGAGGSLEGWQVAQWHPWSVEPTIEGGKVNGCEVVVDVPGRLAKRLALIEEVTGCKLRAEIGRNDVARLHGEARTFAGCLVVFGATPSAHETVEAWRELEEMLES